MNQPQIECVSLSPSLHPKKKKKDSEAIIKCACDLSFPCIPAAVCFNIWDCVTLFRRDESECVRLYLTSKVDSFRSGEPKHAAFPPCGTCLRSSARFGFISKGASRNICTISSLFLHPVSHPRFHQVHSVLCCCFCLCFSMEINVVIVLLKSWNTFFCLFLE